MWGMNVSLLSKITPKNFDSATTGILCSFKQRLGCSAAFLFFVKCTQFVFVGENLKPFSLHHTSSFLSTFVVFVLHCEAPLIYK